MDRQANIGSTIAQAREEKGMSQMGLADRAGLSLRTVERIESGDVTPRRATVQVIAWALKIKPTELQPLEEPDVEATETAA